jgi:hypothetical protein
MGNRGAETPDIPDEVVVVDAGDGVFRHIQDPAIPAIAVSRPLLMPWQNR